MQERIDFLADSRYHKTVEGFHIRANVFFFARCKIKKGKSYKDLPFGPSGET